MDSYQVQSWKKMKRSMQGAQTKKCHQDHDRNEKKENLKSSIILESLLASHLDGEKLLMGKTCVISNILLVGAMEYVERNVPVLLMELAVKNIAGVQNTAVIDLEDVVAQKVNAKVDHVHVLQPTVNVTQMFVKIVGLVAVMTHWGGYLDMKMLSVEI